MLGHHRIVLAAAAEDAAVYFRMQGLDPAVHDFGKAGVLADFFRRDAGVAQQLVGAAGGEDFDALRGECAGEVGDASLVGDAQQSAADRCFHRAGLAVILC